jgi:integrase
VRSSEARGATWSEIDLDNAVWTIPAARMKTKKAEHRVPLSDEAVALLRALPRMQDCDLVFPNTQNKQFSDMALSALLKRMDVNATPHGFRSSFRDWAAECTGAPHEVAEMALAHQIPSAVERAYRRGDLFAKRRHLMDAWGAFCAGRAPVTGEVTPMRKASA